MATTVSEAAKAVNALMSFSSGDQDALLEVLQDYFTSPDGPESDNSEDSGDDDDGIPGISLAAEYYLLLSST